MNIDELTAVMKEVYQIVYSTIAGYEFDSVEEMPEVLISRKQPAMNVRHVIRYMLKRDLRVTHQQVAEAEGVLFGIPTRDHTSIVHSCEIVRSQLGKKQRWKTLMIHIGFFLDVKTNGDAKTTYIDKIKKYSRYDQSGLALALATLVQNRLVSPEILQVILNESSVIEPDFITKTISNPA